jgi:hypothetical protein
MTTARMKTLFDFVEKHGEHEKHKCFLFPDDNCHELLARASTAPIQMTPLTSYYERIKAKASGFLQEHVTRGKVCGRSSRHRAGIGDDACGIEVGGRPGWPMEGGTFNRLALNLILISK